MESIETLIPDNEGNHLVVVLNFYDDIIKTGAFQIPGDFLNFDIADISITKLDLDKPLGLRAFFKMNQWLMDQLTMFPNVIFSFICSTEPLATNHPEISPEQYRWNLFEHFYKRNISKLIEMGIESKDIIVGPDGFQTFARVFYRSNHSPIIHIAINHLTNKYND